MPRKPVLSLAAQMHRANAAAGLASITPTPATPATAGTGGKKRKRSTPAQLISQFHVLQRKQDELAAQKGKMSQAAFAAQHAALEAEYNALGGLQAYQSLSIAGHSSSRYGAFNSAHWIVDVLADAGLGLQSLKGKHQGSGNTLAQPGVSASSSSSSATLDAKKLEKRQKERERKRAKKRAKKEEEEKLQREKEKAEKKAGKKGSNKKPVPVAAAESESEEEEEAEDTEEGDEGEMEEEGGFDVIKSSTPAPTFTPSNKLKLLDVGAITNHYLPYASLIDSTAIDLQPQHPSVQKRDFFELPFDNLNGTYDTVVLSLVLNFVGDRFKRGEMIKKSVRLLKTNGHARLFIVLPSACLKNSRWMNHESFVLKCMRPLGLQLGKFRYTTKLALFEFVREEPQPEPVKEEEEEEEAAEVPAPTKAASKGKNEDAMDESEDTPVKKVLSPAAIAALAAQARNKAKKNRKKGFQPAGIVLEGETRNNFSIAWRAED